MKRAATICSVAGIALVVCALAAGFFILQGCGDTTPPSNRSSSAGGPATDVGWRKAELLVAGKAVEIEYRKYDKPVPLKVVPLSEARRDTPLDAAMSAMTCILAGADFEYYLGHFVNPEIQKGMILSVYSEKQFMTSRQESIDGGELLGEIRVDGHTVVVGVSPAPAGLRYEVGIVMTLKDGKYYIDDKAKRDKPIFIQMSTDHWSIITGGAK